MSALIGFHHVKLPVADVGRSREWYERVLGFELRMEFVEDGVLMGVALRSPDGSVQLAARHDPARAAALAGFDPIALGVPTRSDLEEWLRRFDGLGEPSTIWKTRDERRPVDSTAPPRHRRRGSADARPGLS